jgi:hypothetical protein
MQPRIACQTRSSPASSSSRDMKTSPRWRASSRRSTGRFFAMASISAAFGTGRAPFCRQPPTGPLALHALQLLVGNDKAAADRIIDALQQQPVGRIIGAKTPCRWRGRAAVSFCRAPDRSPDRSDRSGGRAARRACSAVISAIDSSDLSGSTVVGVSPPVRG